VVVTTAAVTHEIFQSNRHHQHTNTELLTCQKKYHIPRTCSPKYHLDLSATWVLTTKETFRNCSNNVFVQAGCPF